MFFVVYNVLSQKLKELKKLSMNYELRTHALSTNNKLFGFCKKFVCCSLRPQETLLSKDPALLYSNPKMVPPIFIFHIQSLSICLGQIKALDNTGLNISKR